jgi:hypothetical protein
MLNAISYVGGRSSSESLHQRKSQFDAQDAAAVPMRGIKTEDT